MRLYDGTAVVDWDIDPNAAVCPSDPAERAKWGWQQDENGRWFRELVNGQKMGEPLPQPMAA